MLRGCFGILLMASALSSQARPDSSRPAFALRLGILNAEVGSDFHIRPRLVWHSDLGYGMNYVKSDYYGRFQHTLDPTVRTGTFLNFGMDWWAFYFNNELRYLSRDETYYLGFKVKVAFPESFLFGNSYDWRDPFKSAYKMGPVVGGISPIGKNKRWFFEVQLGGGVWVNSNFSYAEPAFISNTRLGYRF